MALAKLSIDIVAKLAEFERDMGKAAHASDKAAAEIKKSLDGLKDTAGQFILGLGAGMAAAFSVGAIKEFIGANVDAADELNRLSQSTGVSVEKLSQWGAVAKRNGLDVDDLAEQINELQAKLSETGNATEGAGYALKQLGIDYRDLKKLSSEAAFEQVAQALSKVEDSGQKAAMAMAIGGDEYQKYLPVLNAIGAGGLEVASITTQQARAAAHYKDSLALLTVSGHGLAQTLTAGIVPALDEFVQGLTSAVLGTNGMSTEARRLAANGTITEWARGGVTALTYLIDAGIYTGKVLSSIAKTAAAAAVQVVQSIAGIGDVAGRVLAGDFSGAVDAASAAVGRVKEAGQAWADDMEESWSERTLGAKIRDRIGDIKTVGTSAEAAAASAGKIKVKFDPAAAKLANEAAQKYKELIGGIRDKINAQKSEMMSTEKMTDAEKERASTLAQMADGRIKLSGSYKAGVAAALDERVAIEALWQAHADINKIRGDNSAAQAEIDSGKALTEGQKLALAWMERVRDGRIKLTEQERASTAAKYEKALADEADINQQKDLAKWLDESGAANLKAREDNQARTQSIRDQVDAEKLEVEEIGLSTKALADLTAARQIEKAAALESRAAAMDGLPGFEEQTKAWREQAQAIRDLVTVRQGSASKTEAARKDPLAGVRAGLDAYRQQLSDTASDVQNAFGSIAGGIEGAMASAFTGSADGAKQLFQTIKAEALKLLVIKPILQQLTGAGGGNVLGALASAAGAMFGGGVGNAGMGDYSSAGMAAAFGRAGGGAVSAGSLHQVNERGPELVSTGGKDYLMMGGSGGFVTPITPATPSGSARGPVSITYAPQIQIDSRADRAQVAQDMAAVNRRGQEEMMQMLRERGIA